MTIPDKQDFMLPILKIAGDGNEHSNTEIYEVLAQQFRLSQVDRAELLPSGKDWTFNNRVRWACTHLRYALLLSNTATSKFRITDRGVQVLKENPSHIDFESLRRFPEYVAALRGKSKH